MSRRGEIDGHRPGHAHASDRGRRRSRPTCSSWPSVRSAIPTRSLVSREHALDVYDRDANAAHAAAVEAFEGGRVVIGVFGAPYPCPPAPYELALMLTERFDERRPELRDAGLHRAAAVPADPRAMPAAPPSTGAWHSAGVSLRTATTATEVRAGRGPDRGRWPHPLRPAAGRAAASGAGRRARCRAAGPRVAGSRSMLAPCRHGSRASTRSATSRPSR